MGFVDAIYLQSGDELLIGGLKSPMRLYPYVPAGIHHTEADGFLHHSQSRITHPASASKVCSLFSSDSSKTPVQRLLTQSNQDWFSLRLCIGPVYTWY